MNELQFKVTISANQRTLVSIAKFSVFQDDITFLFGESGIGKSMISKAVYGLLDPDEVQVFVNNQSYENHLRLQWTQDVGKNSFFVFQEPSSHLNPLMKISDQLTEGSIADSANEKDILRYLWQTQQDEAIQKILSVYPKPYRPSGGEKQRVLLAMAFKKINRYLQATMVNQPTFFVFDEPTGSLDNNYRNVFLRFLLRKYVQKPFTILIITHDYSIISEMYLNYKQFMPAVHFQELVRNPDDSVAVRDFYPREYLNWLDTSLSAPKMRAKGDTVLRVHHSFEIFNRSLCICRDQACTTPADLIIRKGEAVYMKAPSGVGKTTLAKIIMGLYRADKLNMDLCNITITNMTDASVWSKMIWGKKAGMVFQHADEALNLQAKVKDVFKGLPVDVKMMDDVLRATLSELFEGEISDAFLQKKVAFLSGGQKQRLNLLRTFVLNPDLIILDEPLNGLDFLSIKKVVSLLEMKLKQGSAIFLISHNEEIMDAVVSRENVFFLREME